MSNMLAYNTNAALNLAKDLAPIAIQNGLANGATSEEEYAKKVATFIKVLATELSTRDIEENGQNVHLY